MATFTRTVNQSDTALSASMARNGRQEITIDQTIDFSLTGNTNTTADVFTLLQVPAGHAVTGCGVEVLKADSAGNSGTILMKVGATSEGSATAPASTGFLSGVGSFTAVAPSGSSALISLTIGTGAINAVVRAWATLSDVRAIPGTGIVTGTGTAPDGKTVTLVQDPVKNYTTPLAYVL